MLRNPKFALSALALLLAAAVLTACGGGSDAETGEAETVSGQFKALPGAPSNLDGIEGAARLTRDESGTRAAIEVSGLIPGDRYVAHLHSGGCERPDAGGPHFQFNRGGSEQPPNEIHFSLKANEAGEGWARATNPRQVPAGKAGSIVLHVAGAHSHMTGLFVHEGEDHGKDEKPVVDKIACADLEAGAAASGGAAEAPTVVVKDGEPVGGVQKLEYSAGDEIRFRVESDLAEEVHVHGYDLLKPVEAGGTVSFAFPAEIEGIFEVELEGSAVQLIELQVNP